MTGYSRLSDLLQEIWTPDVKVNQLSDVVSGIAPLRSIVNVGSGVADLILLPVEQYQKDKRLARGLQRGATSFTKATALEAIRVGARLATGTQVILEKAEAVLGTRFLSTVTAQVQQSDDAQDNSTPLSRYAVQPQDAATGMRNAYKGLSSNLRTTAQTILAVPMEVYERSGTEARRPHVVVIYQLIAYDRVLCEQSYELCRLLYSIQLSAQPMLFAKRC